ncbi:MAG: YeeE/YedE family protein [Pseudomonadota bacterium]
MQQPRLVTLAAASVAVIALLAATFGSVRLAAASLVGALAGFALYHAAFGFTAGWRHLIRERRGGPFRAQLALVAATTLCLLPLIAYSEALGIRAGGFVFPFGVAVAIGAFMFGFGMQLAGGCGSGTLFTVGGGSSRMVVTLIFFIFGGLLATHHFWIWQSLPRLPAVSLAGAIGPLGAIAATAAALGALALLTRRLERRAHGALAPARPMGRLLSGPWSLAVGAAALTLVSVLTVLTLGRPWGITSGLTLWGAQMAHQVGVPIEEWAYWRFAMGQVEASIFASGTSVMNLGLIAGAMLAATLAGKFAPKLRLSRRDVLTAIVGGLLMGYGARVAYGCNIGALLSGIASGSLHGWGWFAFAFIGSIFGVRLRGRIGMDAPLQGRKAAMGT